MKKKVILTTGGTGGHIYPALSVAEELKERDVDVIFVGSNYRMEKDLVPTHDIKFIGLNIKPPKNIKTIFTFVLNIFKGIYIILREKPDAIIGFGNYISVPLVLGGIILRKDVYLQEQNAGLGGVNKLFYPMVKKLFLAFDKTYDDIPMKYQHKLIISGNPLRREILTINIEEEKEKLKIQSDERVLTVTGGSLGAKAINDAMLEQWDKIFENKKLRLYWATGQDNYDEISKKLTKIKIIDTVKPYFNNLINIMAASDLIICRAGALTISELIYLEKPSLVIPYSSKKVGQYSNAEILAENNSAIIYNNRESNDAIEKALSLINDNGKLRKMTSQIKNLKEENSTKKLVDNLDIWRK